MILPEQRYIFSMVFAYQAARMASTMIRNIVAYGYGIHVLFFEIGIFVWLAAARKIFRED